MESTTDLSRSTREKAFFDERARDRAAGDIRAGTYDHVTRFAVAAFDQALSESRVHLEIGCGEQPFTALLSTRSRAVCMDIAVEALKVAKQREPGLDYICADVSALPFRPGAFDGVIGAAILHHLPPQPCRAEVQRVLHPAGTAIFSEPQSGNPAIWLYRKLHREQYSPDERPLSPRDIGQWSKGMTVATQPLDLFGLGLSLVPFLRRSSTAKRAVERLDMFLARYVPALGRFYRYVIVALGREGRTVNLSQIRVESRS
jgi:SAM-dependent methyltransferase